MHIHRHLDHVIHSVGNQNGDSRHGPMMALPSSGSIVPSSSITHPFRNATGLLVVIPDNIDVEEESRFYDELCDVRSNSPPKMTLDEGGL